MNTTNSFLINTAPLPQQLQQEAASSGKNSSLSISEDGIELKNGAANDQENTGFKSILQEQSSVNEKTNPLSAPLKTEHNTDKTDLLNETENMAMLDVVDKPQTEEGDLANTGLLQVNTEANIATIGSVSPENPEESGLKEENLLNVQSSPINTDTLPQHSKVSKSSEEGHNHVNNADQSKAEQSIKTVEMNAEQVVQAPLLSQPNSTNSTPVTADPVLVSQLKTSVNSLQNGEANPLAKTLVSEDSENMPKKGDTEGHDKGGKFMPQGGKNSSFQSVNSENQNERKITTNNLSDFFSKSNLFNQPLANSEASPLNQAAVASLAPTETSSSSLNPAINPSLLAPGQTSIASPDKSIATAPNNALPRFDLNAQFGSNEWNNQINERVRWMGNMNISSAELQLHPAELGSIEIKISTENDQTKVSFFSSNVVTREMLESTLPKLKEMFEEAGLQLEQSDISEQPSAESERQQELTRMNANAELSSEEEQSETELNTLNVNDMNNHQINHYV